MSMTLEQARAQTSEEVTKAEVDAALRAFTPLWETLTPHEQARILRLLIHRVEFDGANRKVAVTFRPNGLKTLGQSGLADNPDWLDQAEESEVDECQTV